MSEFKPCPISSLTLLAAALRIEDPGNELLKGTAEEHAADLTTKAKELDTWNQRTTPTTREDVREKVDELLVRVSANTFTEQEVRAKNEAADEIRELLLAIVQPATEDALDEAFLEGAEQVAEQLAPFVPTPSPTNPAPTGTDSVCESEGVKSRDFVEVMGVLTWAESHIPTGASNAKEALTRLAAHPQGDPQTLPVDETAWIEHSLDTLALAMKVCGDHKEVDGRCTCLLQARWSLQRAVKWVVAAENKAGLLRQALATPQADKPDGPGEVVAWAPYLEDEEFTKPEDGVLFDGATGYLVAFFDKERAEKSHPSYPVMALYRHPPQSDSTEGE